jgi:hypothetical protein
MVASLSSGVIGEAVTTIVSIEELPASAAFAALTTDKRDAQPKAAPMAEVFM